MPRQPKLVDPGRWLVVPKRSESSAKPPYFMCGSGGSNRNGDSVDLIDKLADLSPSSIRLFRAMLKARNLETNMVQKADLSVDARYIYNHLPALVECSLVKRVKSTVFMLNPDAVMPPDIKTMRAIWLSLDKK